MFQVLPVEQFGYDFKWLTSYMFPKIWCPLLEMTILYFDFNAFLYAQGLFFYSYYKKSSEEARKGQIRSYYYIHRK